MGENNKYQKKPFTIKKYWKLYSAGPGMFFLQTYNKSQTLRECPEIFRHLLARQEPIAHTSYIGFGGKKGHVTTYLLKTTRTDLYLNSEIPIEIRSPRKQYDTDTDKKYNILCKHIDLEHLTEELIQCLRDDIEEFCNEKPAKKQTKEGLTIADKIEPSFEITKIPARTDMVKEGKGRFHTTCIIDIGINPSMGCISNTTPEGMYKPENKCSYCYAHQNGPCYIDTVYEFTEKELISMIKNKITELGIEEKNTIYLRIGQNVEANTFPVLNKFKGTVNNLETILKAIVVLSKERRIITAMPSKIIKYNKKTAELLRKAKVSLLASIAYEQLEPGIVLHGFNSQKRMQELLKFAKDGVVSTLFVATDITRSLEFLQDDAKRALEFYEKHRDALNLQFLDMRITRKKDSRIISGTEWRDLLASTQKRLFTDYMGSWRRTGQNHLCAYTTNPDFLRITGNNTGKMRLCSTHVIEEEQRCGKCFMDKL